MKLPSRVKKLITGKNFASFATLMADGSPQVSPVWVDHDGDLILVNTAEGRLKLKNATRDPRVALCIYNQDDPYDKVLVRGRIVEITKRGAEKHIDKMAKKYWGMDVYPSRQAGIGRVLLKMKALRISS